MLDTKRRAHSPFALKNREILVPPRCVRSTSEHYIEEAMEGGLLKSDFGLFDEIGERFGLESVVADASQLSVLST